MPLTTAMDHVARLEVRGHARRMVDPRDRRATRIVLSDAGLAAHRGANLYFERAYGAFAELLTVEEPDATRMLSAIRDAVETARQPLVTRS